MNSRFKAGRARQFDSCDDLEPRWSEPLWPAIGRHGEGNGGAWFPVKGAMLKRVLFRVPDQSGGRLGGWLGLAAALALSGCAANQPAETHTSVPKDGAPTLVSRTGGGGGGWSSAKELEQAASKGNPKAQAEWGETLLRGEGAPKDEARGVALLEQAARAGNSAAAFRIGMLLANGESGVAKDPERALAYFRAAAAGGEKEAFFNIGAAYASARGVKRDYGEALGWLIVARKHGADPQAEQNLRERIKAQPSWIAKGERRAAEIEAEFAGHQVVDFLPPPAPLDEPASNVTAPAIAPSAPPKPSLDLAPADLGKPSLPTLPPPRIEP